MTFYVLCRFNFKSQRAFFDWSLWKKSQHGTIPVKVSVTNTENDRAKFLK